MALVGYILATVALVGYILATVALVGYILATGALVDYILATVALVSYISATVALVSYERVYSLKSQFFAVGHCNGQNDKELVTGYYTNQPSTPVIWRQQYCIVVSRSLVVINRASPPPLTFLRHRHWVEGWSA